MSHKQKSKSSKYTTSTTSKEKLDAPAVGYGAHSNATSPLPDRGSHSNQQSSARDSEHICEPAWGPLIRLVPVYMLPEHLAAVKQFLTSVGQPVFLALSPESQSANELSKLDEEYLALCSESKSSVELVSMFASMFVSHDQVHANMSCSQNTHHAHYKTSSAAGHILQCPVFPIQGAPPSPLLPYPLSNSSCLSHLVPNPAMVSLSLAPTANQQCYVFPASPNMLSVQFTSRPASVPITVSSTPAFFAVCQEHLSAPAAPSHVHQHQSTFLTQVTLPGPSLIQTPSHPASALPPAMLDIYNPPFVYPNQAAHFCQLSVHLSAPMHRKYYIITVGKQCGVFWEKWWVILFLLVDSCQ